MRNAENGPAFAEEIRRRFGFSVNIIPGEREAELIYKGIMESVALKEQTAMIVDIGGGSIEFIICNKEEVLWKQSFELGMARILEAFSVSDPITAAEITDVENYFESELQPLIEAVKKYNEGMKLSKHCHDLLKEAEGVIVKMMKDDKEVDFNE